MTELPIHERPTHTLGPWKRQRIGAHLQIVAPPSPRGGARPVICWMSSRRPEREGDARLIEAAPMLLAAIKHLSTISEDIVCAGLSDSECAALRAAWSKIDAAIAAFEAAD